MKTFDQRGPSQQIARVPQLRPRGEVGGGPVRTATQTDGGLMDSKLKPGWSANNAH